MRLTRFQRGIAAVTMIVLAAKIFWTRLDGAWFWLATYRDYANAWTALAHARNGDLQQIVLTMFGTVLRVVS